MYNHERKNKKSKWAKAIRFEKIVKKRNLFDLLIKMTKTIQEINKTDQILKTGLDHEFFNVEVMWSFGFKKGGPDQEGQQQVKNGVGLSVRVTGNAST